ncbi:polysaccharide pyruvyl transferase CsaB [Synechococcus sp. CS-603]|uniref:polysaccharide pyruvyl transferase CsaB n=1 Tax=Synechococcus sp. CS-603 TaxID=2847981 RepID=UPI00223C2107|nr:polysaccharide pyruvyl transferase CsaB [Synechococcus sp. CS-603]MCT0202335.1 polysaccharide pyruvyl transferase CsaB [Synechococcus sp. CS-603]
MLRPPTSTPSLVDPSPADPTRAASAAADPRVLLCGYYGEHNLGDDALLEALLGQLPAGIVPVVTAFDQAEIERCFALETTQRRQLPAVLATLGSCRALVLGGGSLLQDSTSFRSLLYYAALILAARLKRKPVLLWGQGLGPLSRRRSRLLVRSLLPLVQAISWRDAASAQLASSWGLQGDVAADPVWSLPAQVWQGAGGPIVLCWRPSVLLEGRQWSPLLEAVDGLAAGCKRQVIWLPFHRDQDCGLLCRLAAEGLVPERLLQRSEECQIDHPAAASDLFSGAGLVVAMRLHGLILAALAGAPCVALSYDPKVAAAAGAIDCPCQDLDQAVTAKDLRMSWEQQLDQPSLPNKIAELRASTAIHAKLLNRWLKPELL